MSIQIVFTLTGPDRVGIVETVTRALLQVGGNVETSRMARLGGEFAILMLVSIPSERLEGIDQAFAELSAQGYRIAVSRTEPERVTSHADWPVYQIDVRGADHEGIVHEIARGLSKCGINIESMETHTTPAPMSGIPLFSMSVQVAVPPQLAEEEWRSALSEAAQHSGVDVTVAPVGAK